MAKIDLVKTMLAGAKVVDKEETDFNIDRSKYMNASSCMSCIRRQWYDRKHGDGDQDWGFAYRGRHAETYMVKVLKAGLPKGWELTMTGEEQQSLVSEKHRISATPDGYLDHEDGTSIYVEFKSIDPRTNMANLPKKPHTVQVQVGMEIDAAQEEGFAGCDYGMLVYMNASNYNILHSFRVERDKGLLDRLAPRATKLLNAKSDKSLDREGKSSGECRTSTVVCPHLGRCGIEVEGPAKVSRGNKGSALDAAVRTYTMAKADEELAKVAKAAAGEEIKQGLKARNVSKLEVGNRVVDLQQRAGNTTVDWRKAEADGINLDPYKKVGSPFELLIVK
jgi:hypothetical protein